MRFEIDDFIVSTDSKIVELSEQIIVPIKLSYNKKPEEFAIKNKTKEITVFSNLYFFEKEEEAYYSVITDMFVFIDLVEILKAFSSNKLDTKKEYNLSDRFTAKIAQKNGNISLKIHFKNYSNSLYLDKFESSSLAAKFTKIIQRCEAWQESEV